MDKFKKCCNPFNFPPSHSRSTQDLRRFPRDYLPQFPDFTEKSWLCSTCRKDLKKQVRVEGDGNEEEMRCDDIIMVESEESRGEELETESQENTNGQSFSASPLSSLSSLSQCISEEYVPTSSQKRQLESIDLILGVSPVKRQKLNVKTYRQKKCEEIQESAKSKFQSDFEIIVEEDEKQNIVDDHMHILAQIKKSYAESHSTDLKKTLISLLPVHWSENKIQQETGASSWIIRQVRRKDIIEGEVKMASKPGNKPLSESTREEIEKFYEDDENSRQLPGMKDYVLVKSKDDQRVKLQKRLVLSNLKELHVKFKEEHPTSKVSFSTFASLRPKHCVLAGAAGTHTVCVCLIHQNTKLMLEGCGFSKLFSGSDFGQEQKIPNYRSLLSFIVCSPPTNDCYDRSCVKCCDTSEITDIFTTRFDENEIDTIEYKTWTMTDHCSIITSSCSGDGFTDRLRQNLEKLVLHDYIATQQSRFLREAKESLKEGDLIVIMDFSENYSFTVQDAVQAFHWNNNRATVFPIVVYYRETNELHPLSFVGISDCMTHDTISVYMFQTELMTFLKSRFSIINKISYFTDGAAAQFKNKKSFANLLNHDRDFGIIAEWHFFATAHGNGPSDGVGGCVKRLARLASLKMGSGEQMLNAKDLFEWAKRNIQSVHFVFCSQADYDFHKSNLSSRFASTQTVKGTLSFHNVIPIDSSTSLMFKKFSNCEKSQILPVYP